MTAVTVDEIKRELPAWLRRVKAGETVVVTQGGRPVAEIRPVSDEHKELRPFGLCAGEFVVPDDFDEPLPESVLRDFEGR